MKVAHPDGGAKSSGCASCASTTLALSALVSARCTEQSPCTWPICRTYNRNSIPSESPGVMWLACGRSSTPGHRRTSSITFVANCSRSSDDSMQPSGVNDRSRRGAGRWTPALLKAYSVPRLRLCASSHRVPMPRRPVRAHLFVALVVFAPLQVGRAQWLPVPSRTEAELRGLSVPSPSVMWASGQRGIVLHTVDDADAWTYDTIPGAAALDLRAIDATSAQVAHAISIGDSSRIYRTTDGGRTWSLGCGAT